MSDHLDKCVTNFCWYDIYMSEKIILLQTNDNNISIDLYNLELELRVYRVYKVCYFFEKSNSTLLLASPINLDSNPNQ